MLGGAAAIYSFSEIEEELERITEQSVPAVLSSLRLSRDAEGLVAAAPALLTSTTQEEHKRRSTSIREDIGQLGIVLDDLNSLNVDTSFIEPIASAVNWLTLNLISVETTVGNALAIGEQRRALTQSALAEALAMQRILAPMIEELDARIDTIEDGGATLGPNDPKAATLFWNDSAYQAPAWVLMRLNFAVAALPDRLASIALIEDRDALNATKQQFTDELGRIEKLVARLDAPLRDELMEHATPLQGYVDGPRSVLRTRLLELNARSNAQRLLTESGNASRQLTQAVDRLVSDTEEGVRQAGIEARQKSRTGTILLIVVVILSLASSVLIVWLYVERSMIRRLTALSRSMLAIARGNLKTEIPSGGSDEISSMADALTVFRAATAERAVAERARANLSRYFSPNLVDHLADDPMSFQAGGERRELTFVFTDLAGFTTLVEELDPAIVVPLMNEYIGGVAGIMFEHGGTVDTVAGDAVHAIFGAPLKQPDHAARGVACALAIDEFSQAFIEKKAGENISVGVTRIGVHTGSAIVGNFGGESYFHYTAHGDTVNTTARLETANKALGTRMCVSADTVALIPDFVGRPIGELSLKGKTKEIGAFEPVPRAESGSVQLRAYLAAFEKIKTGDPDCIRAFASYVGDYGSEPLANFHLQRLLAGTISTKIPLAEI